MRRRRKVLCSIGAGTHAKLLDASRETFAVYAQRHGYDLCLLNDVLVRDRPASWSKVPLLLDLLAKYDIALWVDADAAFADVSTDIVGSLGRRDLMGLVAHRTPAGDSIPNCGVWVLRRSWWIRLFLKRVWRSTAYVEHRWWENAAVLTFLGYEIEPTVRLAKPSYVYKRTKLLPVEWNSISLDVAAHPRIRHFPGEPLDARLVGLQATRDELLRNENRRPD